MSTMRRATYRAGGVGGATAAPGNPGNVATAQPRTLGAPDMPSGLRVQPPYRVGTAPRGQGGPGTHPYLDFTRPQAWRNVGALFAAAYVGGFHLTLGGVRIRAPIPHGHAFGLGLYIASWVYLWKYGADVISAAYVDKPALAALHQAF
jgi:hypothetical protein